MGHADACASPDRGFYTTMLLNMVYPAIASPLFAGVESYFFLDAYCEEMRAILSLPSVRTGVTRCVAWDPRGAHFASRCRR